MTTGGKRQPRLIAVGAVMALVCSVVFFATPAYAAEEDVSSNHDADWHQRDVVCSGLNTGDQDFMSGPAGVPGEPDDDGPNETPGDSLTGAPPAGGGSLRMRTGADGGSLVDIRNTRYAGRLLSEIQDINYWTFTQSISLPGQDFIPTIYLGLEIDTTGDNLADETLVFEPGFQQTDDEAGEEQHEVAPGTWQQWVAKDVGITDEEGYWYLEDDKIAGDPVFRSIEGWIGNLPAGTKIVNRTDLDGMSDQDWMGGVFLAAGCGDDTWDNFTGFVDAASLTFTSTTSPYNSVLYDMEPLIPTGANRLDCTPEEDAKPTGKTHEITCTARNGDARVGGVEIDVEAIGPNDPDNGDTPQTADFDCTTRQDDPATTGTNEAGTCSVRHGPGGRGTTRTVGVTTYVAWIDEDGKSDTVEADRVEETNESAEDGARPEPDQTDVVEIRWVPLLDCERETVTLPPGQANTITCTVRDAAGAVINGMNVDIEMSGPNDSENPTTNSFTSPDLSCDTGATGTCSVTHGPGGVGTTSATGRTVYRAWNDYDANNATSDLDTSEGRSETTAPGNEAETDYTDVIEANWSQTAPTPTPTTSTTPNQTPCPTPSPSGASPSPSASPCPSPTPTPTPSASRTASPSPRPTITPPPPQRECGDGSGNSIGGTSGNDILIGTPGADTICGFGGNDIIRGRGGNDRILAGGGADLARGGRGGDVLKGSGGGDELIGGAGNDILRGGPGNDDLDGGGGNDRLDGGGGRDRCAGGKGRNKLVRCE